MQHTTDLELAAHQLGERRLNDTALVMTALVPWIREEQHQAVKAVVGNAAVEHLNRIAVVNTQVGEALGQHSVEQRAHARAMHFDADKVLLRRRRSHLQQRMAHAKADFEGTWCRTAEHLVVVNRRISQRQHE